MYENKKQKLDNILENIQNLFSNYISNYRYKLDLLWSNYILNNPSVLYKDKKIYLANLIEKLELINPMGVLKRGYSLSTQDNHVIKSIKNLDVNKDLVIKLYDGNIITNIKEVEEINNE